MRRLLIGLISSTVAVSAMATTVGVSSHPFTMKKHVITTEFNSYLSDGSGMGISAKYFQRVNDALNFDMGFGFTDGERSSRFVMGADAQILPDYGRQPRVSIKGSLETENIDNDRINTVGAAPTMSKGFAFWGREAFPFIALPVKVSLNTSEGTYETSTAIAMGITGRIPVGGFKDLVGNIETNISLRNSYAALVMGVSLPIQ
jgi:hypothetical protein